MGLGLETTSARFYNLSPPTLQVIYKHVHIYNASLKNKRPTSSQEGLTSVSSQSCHSLSRGWWILHHFVWNRNPVCKIITKCCTIIFFQGEKNPIPDHLSRFLHIKLRLKSYECNLKASNLSHRFLHLCKRLTRGEQFNCWVYNIIILKSWSWR